MMNAIEAYSTKTEFTIQRYALERAVRALPKVDGIALIRAAYDCSLGEAKFLSTIITER